MALTVIKNWDNKTWLSSKDYINSFNKFLIKNININSKFKVLDIGCGRGKILGALSSKLKLKIAKIRGVESFGMLCSESELNISNESAGIIDLKKNSGWIHKSQLIKSKSLITTSEKILYKL